MPAVTSAIDDSGSYELGLRFSSDVPGSIVGIRFYKGDLQAAHTVRLWDSSGAEMASATSTTETASGWQQVNFGSAITIDANTQYVASYHVPAGRYAYDANYFVSTGVDSGPLHATYAGNSPSLLTSPSGFPTSPRSANYWVDVVFEPDTTQSPPLVAAKTPAPNAAGVAITSSITASFTEAVDPDTITFELRDAGNNLVQADFSYDSATHVVTLTPSSPLTHSRTYTATISGAEDLAGNPMASPVSWSFTTVADLSVPSSSLWSDSTVPSVTSENDSGSYELGVKFRSTEDGYVTGIRFYKGVGNTGTHVGNLWSSSGANLASATFTGETATGWQTVYFNPPVLITAGTTYVASYHAPVGHYAADSGYFSSTGFTNGPLYALQSGEDGPNGVYAEGATSAFPTTSYGHTNYWVDVMFVSRAATIGPDITPATTSEDTQSTSGLVVTPNPASTGITHFKITGITDGTLYQNDGVTPINNGDFITLAQGAAGLKFTPAANFAGAATFGVQSATSASDAGLKGLVTAANIAVTPVNDAPVAQDDSGAVAEDGTLIVAAPGTLANDSDLENDPLTAILVAGPSHGTLTLNADGSFTYTPNANYTGTDSFTYRASDGQAQSAPATVSLTITPVNDAPQAANDSYSTDRDTPLVLAAPGVLANDADPESDPITALLVSAPTHGTLTLNPDGSFTYTPEAGYFGPDSFTYRAKDAELESNTATVNITINAVNDAPVANSDAFAVDEDNTLTVPAPGVLGNDTDANSDPLTAILAAGPSHGSLTLNPNGSFTYTPAPGYSGPDSFTYRANDGALDSAQATVNITVNPVNDPPVATGDSYSADEDATLVLPAPGVLANDSDPDSAALTAVLVAGPSHGTLTLNADGSFSYSPSPNYSGPDSFTYKASDGALFSNVATVTIDVKAINDAPVAVNDSYTTNEDHILLIADSGVLANDSDPEGDSLTAAVQTNPSHGTVVMTPDGLFIYTPNANFHGTDTFTYKVSDGKSQGAIGTVTIAVNSVNDVPAAKNDSYSTSQGVPITISAPGVLGNDADPDGDPLTAVLGTGPAHGTLTFNVHGSFTYTPDPLYSGVDSFTYQASDGIQNSELATVTLTINHVNHAPVAADDAYSTDEDTKLLIPIPGLLANDKDVDGDLLSAVLDASPSHGSLSVYSDGMILYTPYSDWSGTDTFTYKASDGALFSNPATVTITVNPTNDAPTAKNDSYSTNEDTLLTIAGPGVLGNDADVEGDALTAILDKGPSHGVLTLNPDGSFMYLPAANYFGTDTFTYRANDGQANGNLATVTIVIASVNDAPAAGDDSKSMTEDTQLQLPISDLLANDSDVDGDLLSLVSVGTAGHGSVQVVGDKVVYTPNANYFGADSITYKISDGQGGSATATVRVTVTNVNDAPVVTGESYSMYEDTVLNVPARGVLSNDTDADGDTLTAILGSGPAHGTLSLNANGSFTYTPNSNYFGADSFTYRVSDGAVQSNPLTVNITIEPSNDFPVARNDSRVAWEDLPMPIPASELLANDYDPEGDPLQVTSVGPAANGTVQLKNGVIIYQAKANYYGTDTFTYTITDGKGGTSTATVTMTINRLNDDVVAINDNFTINEDSGPVSLQVLANDKAVNPDPGEALKIISITNPTNGTATITNNGAVIQYTPNANFYGSDTLTYTVRDPGGRTATATVNITVKSVNDAPVARDDEKIMAENTTLEFSANSLLANDSDIDGDVLTVTAVDKASHGTVSLKDGKITYIPAKDYFGPDSFSYTITDPGGKTATAKVNVTVSEVITAPLAGDDFAAVAEDKLLTISVADLLANDTDADGDKLSLVSVSAGAQTQGTVELKDAQVIFSPTADFHGVTSFTYTVSDGRGGTATGTVTVSVQAVNDAPVLAPIPGTIAADEGSLVQFQATATDVDLDTLTFSLIGAPSGAAIDPQTGAFSWVPTFEQSGIHIFWVQVTDNGAPRLATAQPVTIAVKDVTKPQLQVVSLAATPSGFDVQFNQPIDFAMLNLYDGLDSTADASDLTLVGRTTGSVAGSVIWDPASNTLHFVKTGTPLAADTYDVKLFSRTDAFAGLDGDKDGAAGGDYQGSFTISPSNASLLSLPDITRGPGQTLDLPIRISQASAALSVDLELAFDPALLDVTEITLADGAPADWDLLTNQIAPGRVVIAAYGITGLPSGVSDLLKVKATVPATAPYGAAGLLSLQNVKIDENPALADSAVLAVAYLGDASGNKMYSGMDAALISNVAVGNYSGFDAFPLIDPILIADVTGNGALSGLDASYVAQESIGINRPEIPDLPSAAPAAFAQAPIQASASLNSVLSASKAKARELPFSSRAINAALLA